MLGDNDKNAFKWMDQLSDPDFKKCFRMDRDAFAALQKLIDPLLSQIHKDVKQACRDWKWLSCLN